MKLLPAFIMEICLILTRYMRSDEVQLSLFIIICKKRFGLKKIDKPLKKAAIL